MQRLYSVELDKKTIVNDEWLIVRKEATVAHLKVLFLNSLGKTYGNLSG